MNSDSSVLLTSLPDNSSWFVSFGHWIQHLMPFLGKTGTSFFGLLVGLSIVLSFFFLIGIIYCVEGLKKIRDKEGLIHEAKVDEGFEDAKPADNIMARHWANAVKQIASDNSNDWKQAIIEADIILDDLLTKLGYRGETIGDKLKRVATGDMKSLNEAWEAHKVRNQIAHEPGFALNHSEANDVINMYKKVFEEFYYI